ncbi:MAG: crossover junction endodeoxyribonuclease RuvC [Proteobacteria bacterium]|nr:crossover junction endodeoxyribonuclease RuvC [Pseudomonadota bacterium]MBU1231903.1 crossover junction endodeoxyribonuclease RuvC [Pseudomonadota bacterium]MBU1419139.1 crossover junction endodeoxyribonuclease RuvC [Pseudomonadota bacterium]MBU1455097.1 crossover junction endodeoxyribonuclease RuvC [Pseudomonadota bacterium]
MQRILGIDPGSRITGYGIVDAGRGKISFVSCGVIKTTARFPLANRLNEIFEGINEVIQLHDPEVAAVEEVFMSTNANSALKLGQARGAAVVAAMQNGLGVYDYSAKKVKQAVVGYGQAEKGQVQHMIRVLLGLSATPSNDAADALAVAICHANQMIL